MTERHGYEVRRDTVIGILEESDPRTGRWRDRRNREKSYYKLIYALAHQFCGDGKDGLSANAAEEIARLVQNQSDSIEVEVVREILKDAKRTFESNV